MRTKKILCTMLIWTGIACAQTNQVLGDGDRLGVSAEHGAKDAWLTSWGEEGSWAFAVVNGPPAQAHAKQKLVLMVALVNPSTGNAHYSVGIVSPAQTIPISGAIRMEVHLDADLRCIRGRLAYLILLVPEKVSPADLLTPQHAEKLGAQILAAGTHELQREGCQQ